MALNGKAAEGGVWQGKLGYMKPKARRIKMKKYVVIIGSALLLGMSGCGKNEQSITSYPQNIEQNEVNEELEEKDSIEQEVADNPADGTMNIYSEAHTISIPLLTAILIMII